MGIPSRIHLHRWVTFLLSMLESLLAVPDLVSISRAIQQLGFGSAPLPRRACPAFPGRKTNRAVEIFRKHLLQFSQQGCS